MEIQEDGHYITKTVESDQWIHIRNVGDEWILGERPFSKELVLISLKNKKMLKLSMMGRDLRVLAIVSGKMVYEETL